MTTFAQVSDLQSFTGQNLNTSQAQTALNNATGQMQEWIGQQIFQVTNDTVILDPRPDMSVMLPETPVTAVSSVAWFDDFNGTGWNTLPTTLYRWKEWGRLYIIPTQVHTYTATGGLWGSTWWPAGEDTIQVTYSHGYSVIPSSLQAVCMALAARLLINPYKLQSTRTGEVQVVYTGVREASELLDTEKVVLDRYSIEGFA